MNSKLSPENNKKVEEVFESLWNKILVNLEENCQINQSLRDLEDLRTQNENNLQLKITNLLKVSNNTATYSETSQEIESLKKVMENNENIYAETEEALDKNIQDKKSIQEILLHVTSKYQQSARSSADHYQKLEKTLQTLSNAKSNPHKQNNEVFQEVKALAEQNLKNENKIMNLEKYIEDMHRKLKEKVRY